MAYSLKDAIIRCQERCQRDGDAYVVLLDTQNDNLIVQTHAAKRPPNTRIVYEEWPVLDIPNSAGIQELKTPCPRCGEEITSYWSERGFISARPIAVGLVGDTIWHNQCLHQCLREANPEPEGPSST